MIMFYKIPMEVWVVAPRLRGPTEEEGERLDAAESTRSEGCRGLQMLRARSLIHVGAGASACASKRDSGFSRNPCEPSRAGPSCGGELQERGTDGGVRLCEHVRGGGDGDKLPEDVLGHLYIVLCNHQCFLDVLVGVTLTHQVLDLRADLRIGFSCCCSTTGGGRDRRDRAVSAF